MGLEKWCEKYDLRKFLPRKFTDFKANTGISYTGIKIFVNCQMVFPDKKRELFLHKRVESVKLGLKYIE